MSRTHGERAIYGAILLGAVLIAAGLVAQQLASLILATMLTVIVSLPTVGDRRAPRATGRPPRSGRVHRPARGRRGRRRSAGAAAAPAHRPGPDADHRRASADPGRRGETELGDRRSPRPRRLPAPARPDHPGPRPVPAARTHHHDRRQRGHPHRRRGHRPHHRVLHRGAALPPHQRRSLSMFSAQATTAGRWRRARSHPRRLARLAARPGGIDGAHRSDALCRPRARRRPAVRARLRRAQRLRRGGALPRGALAGGIPPRWPSPSPSPPDTRSSCWPSTSSSTRSRPT